MKFLRRFNENISIYDPKWKDLLPQTITVLKGQDHGIDTWVYQKGNVMLNADMIQISYGISEWMAPDTFEIDIYFVKSDNTEKRIDLTKVVDGGKIDYDRSPGKYIPNLRLDVDITFGDEMACEFSIDKKGIKLLQHTTYGSKFDPSNTLFAIEDRDLEKLVEFFNRFNYGIKISIEDLHFLRNK
jgi:hypothetical protein